MNTQISDATLIAFFATSSADMSAEEIAKKAIKVASEICVFTNDNIKVHKI